MKRKGKMKTITTKELSSMFNIQHRDIKDIVRNNPHNDLFTLCNYRSLQNKVLQCFSMGAEGLDLVLRSSTFLRGDRLITTLDLLESFGINKDARIYERKNTEDNFYHMLCEFLPDETITRQFKIGKHYVDFYLDDHFLVIEYDESYHESTSQNKKDDIRESYIRRVVLNDSDDYQPIIRVKAGKEITGLSMIAGYLACHSTNAEAIVRLDKVVIPTA